ncbi:RibD family protein [Variovorax sp. J22R133]|uniref:RibD family protein n=1 Tax=Variovorax brevis TaxID=3053503 RepID=UPI002576E95D|nr:RibD family protein [Variovorax sp. J22R133]MDM0111228.1 RibD family protein [Variovorax sp. J22R133]
MNDRLPLPHMIPALSAGAGIDALWSLCLDIVQRRRNGGVGQGGPAVPGVAGFELGEGWSAEAVELFSLIKPILDRSAGSPAWVVGQLGQSLNGCIATRGGDANYVNGAEVLQHLHRLRALCDAVIVGTDTAAIDNPQLTTRHVAGDNPVRVLLDPRLRLPPTLRALSDRRARTLLVCDATRQHEAAERVGKDQTLGVPGLVDVEGNMNLRALLVALQARGLRVIFVEGGGVTVSRFIEQGCMDRLHLSVAPVVIGEGRPGLMLAQNVSMAECLRPSSRVYRMGADVMWDLDLRGSGAA